MANEIQKIQEIDTNENATNINQITSEKLFEGATMENIGNAPFDPAKQYVYRDGTTYLPISDADHFTCIKDGYWDIAANTNTNDSDDVTEYFTKADNGDLVHCEVPAIANRTWADRLVFSAQIENADMYTVRPVDNLNANKTKVYLSDEFGNRTYYNKENNDYIKQSIITYDKLSEVENIWNEEYICKATLVHDEDGKPRKVSNWLREGVSVTESGYYLYYLEFNDSYKIGLFNMTFNGQNECTNISGLSSAAKIYRLPASFQNNPMPLYISLNGILQELDIIDNYDKVTVLPEFDTEAKAYTKLGPWTYPDIMDFSNDSLELSDSDNNYIVYSTELFPPYDQEIIQNPIVKTKSTQYPIFEKTAKIINYRYTDSGSAQPLQLIFTDKTKAKVLNDCGLTPDNLGADISDYVHLTNIKLND